MTAPGHASTLAFRSTMKKSKMRGSWESNAVIAVVDDDPSVQRGLARLIRSIGLKPETFASAHEFLARRTEPVCMFALAISYWYGGSGLAVVQPSRPTSPRAEVVQYAWRHRTAVALAVGLLAIFFIVPVHAQSYPTQYVATVWQTEQGLPQNTVVSMLQDHDGYIWLATGGGLVRFDGVNFKVFDAADLPGLVSTRVGAVYESRSGALWIGAFD